MIFAVLNKMQTQVDLLHPINGSNSVLHFSLQRFFFRQIITVLKNYKNSIHIHNCLKSLLRVSESGDAMNS